MRFAIAICLILLGCSEAHIPPIRFTRPGASREVYFRDRYDCILSARNRVAYYTETPIMNRWIRQGYSGTETSREIFISCMMARGWILHPQGEFFAPPGGQVYLQ